MDRPFLGGMRPPILVSRIVSSFLVPESETSDTSEHLESPLEKTNKVYKADQRKRNSGDILQGLIFS